VQVELASHQTAAIILPAMMWMATAPPFCHVLTVSTTSKMTWVDFARQALVPCLTAATTIRRAVTLMGTAMRLVAVSAAPIT